MSKLFNVKTLSMIALTFSMLLGALVATPVTSAFARKSPAYIPAKQASGDTPGTASYREKNIDEDVYLTNVVPYLWLYSPDNFRADGKWSRKGR